VIGLKERNRNRALEIEPGDLEHIRKWPSEHWTLAFQGQIRTVSAHDADLLLSRMRAAAGVTA
jgi:hypothetical protein